MTLTRNSIFNWNRSAILKCSNYTTRPDVSKRQIELNCRVSNANVRRTGFREIYNSAACVVGELKTKGVRLKVDFCRRQSDTTPTRSSRKHAVITFSATVATREFDPRTRPDPFRMWNVQNKYLSHAMVCRRRERRDDNTINNRFRVPRAPARVCWVGGGERIRRPSTYIHMCKHCVNIVYEKYDSVDDDALHIVYYRFTRGKNRRRLRRGNSFVKQSQRKPTKCVFFDFYLFV